MTGNPADQRPLGMPPRPHLPLAVYGSLRIGELAFSQIRPYVSHHESFTLAGHQLWIVDGLPTAAIASGSTLEVDLFDLAQAGYELVGRFEPKSLYKWGRCEVVLRGRVTEANIVLGKRLDNAEYPIGRKWTSASDRVLSVGLPTVEAMFSEILGWTGAPFRDEDPQPSAFWPALMRVEAAYLLLWSVLERYSTLRCGPPGGPEARMTKLFMDPAWISAVVAAKVPVGQIIRDSRYNKPVCKAGGDGEKAGRYFRQIRHNLTHRGKAAQRDARTVVAALVDCFNTTFYMLQGTVPGITQEWQNVAGKPLRPLSKATVDKLFPPH